jgi:hypothetical protein
MIEADAGTRRQVATVIIVGANSKIIPQLCNARKPKKRAIVIKKLFGYAEFIFLRRVS